MERRALGGHTRGLPRRDRLGRKGAFLWRSVGQGNLRVRVLGRGLGWRDGHDGAISNLEMAEGADNKSKDKSPRICRDRETQRDTERQRNTKVTPKELRGSPSPVCKAPLQELQELCSQMKLKRMTTDEKKYVMGRWVDWGFHLYPPK